VIRKRFKKKKTDEKMSWKAEVEFDEKWSVNPILEFSSVGEGNRKIFQIDACRNSICR